MQIRSYLLENPSPVLQIRAHVLQITVRGFQIFPHVLEILPPRNEFAAHVSQNRTHGGEIFPSGNEIAGHRREIFCHHRRTRAKPSTRTARFPRACTLPSLGAARLRRALIRSVTPNNPRSPAMRPYPSTAVSPEQRCWRTAPPQGLIWARRSLAPPCLERALRARCLVLTERAATG